MFEYIKNAANAVANLAGRVTDNLMPNVRYYFVVGNYKISGKIFNVSNYFLESLKGFLRKINPTRFNAEHLHSPFSKLYRWIKEEPFTNFSFLSLVSAAVIRGSVSPIIRFAYALAKQGVYFATLGGLIRSLGYMVYVNSPENERIELDRVLAEFGGFLAVGEVPLVIEEVPQIEYRPSLAVEEVNNNSALQIECIPSDEELSDSDSEYSEIEYEHNGEVVTLKNKHINEKNILPEDNVKKGRLRKNI